MANPTTTNAPKPPTLPMEPWQYLAVLAKCAAEAGIEVDRAFRFMGAVTVALAQGAKSAAPPMPPSSGTPQ